jgi:hypothetical protein
MVTFVVLGKDSKLFEAIKSYSEGPCVKYRPGDRLGLAEHVLRLLRPIMKQLVKIWIIPAHRTKIYTRKIKFDPIQKLSLKTDIIYCNWRQEKF